MKCDDARSAFLSGDAGQAELDHLGSCSDCRSEWDALETSRQVLDDPALWEDPSPALEEQVVGLIGGTSEPTGHPRRNTWLWALASGSAAALVAMAVWIGLPGTSPDWEVALPGTSEAPEASGVVRGWNEPSGTRIALDIEGLPPAPDGSLYEFWLSSGDLHISAGTFVAPESVELWAGVSRAEFPRLWITLEPVDEDESPSGKNLMDTG